jgi:DNA (cytosine-5)-methyltransferase 1
MRFIDLFAGIGGFHVGLSKLGHTCVYASEIDAKVQKIYSHNFRIEPDGDIRKVRVERIPEHDILCAGFPCQSFSKAGFQLGLDDLSRGNLFYDIARILDYHKPSYFILENVSNLEHHDNGRTWHIISNILEELGYTIDKKKISPHHFGVPQIRERLFIVGSREGLKSFEWPQKRTSSNLSINSILEVDPLEFKALPKREIKCLNIWQRFLNKIPKKDKLPSFPIWAMEFGATYPYEGTNPFRLNQKELSKYKGSFGCRLKGLSKQEQLNSIPPYALTDGKNYPDWKKNFIRQNREFYLLYRKKIDKILPEIAQLQTSWQKFEWNCQGEERNISKLIIQFRSSGVRVKKSNYSPALVSSTTTQIPIIGWQNRYITVKEASRLQCLESIEFPVDNSIAFKALGNAVNSLIVELIAENLIGRNNGKVVTANQYQLQTAQSSEIVGCLTN